MAFKPGFNSWFQLDSVAGSLVDLRPYVDTVQVPQTVQQLDVSTIGTGTKNFIPGLTDGDTITVSGPYDVTVWSQLTGLKAAQNLGSATSTVLYGPGGSVAGQAKESAEAFLASLTFNTTVGGRVEWSASLQVTGAVTLGTF